jgi:ribonuclease D
MLRTIPVVPASLWHLNPGRTTLPQHAWRWGLSNTVGFLLGLRLDKRLQCSDWGARPLSAAQLSYASVDAHCLTRVCTHTHVSQRLYARTSVRSEKKARPRGRALPHPGAHTRSRLAASLRTDICPQ